MPSWPLAIPSSIAMVLNPFATPPAASISRATSWPRSFRCTWPGTNCVNELATAMIGLWKSSSFMPVARQRARAPAMLRPAVEVRERYAGMGHLGESADWKNDEEESERIAEKRPGRRGAAGLSDRTQRRMDALPVGASQGEPAKFQR